MSKTSIRTIINPFLVIGGLLVVISGFFLFFRIKSPVIKFCHEVGGFIFVIALVVHVAVNWKGLVASSKGMMSAKVLVVILAVCIIGMALSAYFMPAPGHGRPGMSQKEPVEQNAPAPSAPAPVEQNEPAP